MRLARLPNSRRVRWLSASISQWYRAWLDQTTAGPHQALLQLVSDQFSIFFGSTLFCASRQRYSHS